MYEKVMAMLFPEGTQPQVSTAAGLVVGLLTPAQATLLTGTKVILFCAGRFVVLIWWTVCEIQD